ncbi:protein zwilch homolog [Linepithema humile]|uniref:protein zwilch homolog n=1 Tax=Linepithema humile TaxID=83485 RepID=UPI0006231D55|nr:PREDICTED: protein zwilch homolog [Linepithema humile]
MDHLNNILQSHIRASKIRLSYVDELFPDLKDNPYIILHKNVPIVQFSDCEKRERSFDECTKYDVSGSPLEYSFGNYKFDETIVTRQNWQKEEELYLPLSRKDACNALNMCLEYLDNNTLPILALCDGRDAKQSRLIGASVSENWFTTLEAVSTGMTTMAIKRDDCRRILQEHLEQSFAQEHDVKISMLNIFDIFGTKQERINWDKTAKKDYEGSISIEMYSNNLTLDLRLSQTTLVTEINAGWKNSPLKGIRNELLLLVQYLSIIDELKKNIGLQKPIKFSTPYLEEHDAIIEKINLLLNGDLSFERFGNNNVRDTNYINKGNAEIDAKLLERVQNICSRHDIDFIDFLWEILTKTSEYSQMIDYIETVLKEILEYNFTPQINDTNSTRFVKCISDLRCQETISHLLVGSVPLELVVDMGFEKLIRDYLYILRGARFINLHDVRQKLIDRSTGIFNTENYRKKLITLAQIHICLECMLFIEEHMECSIENLQNLFVCAYKEFVSAQSPLQHYNELCNEIFTLKTPLSNLIANEMNKIYPSLWKTSISSHSVASMLTTTAHYSKMPIFPTNIHPTDDINAQQGTVYGISATSSSTKYKKFNAKSETQHSRTSVQEVK